MFRNLVFAACSLFLLVSCESKDGQAQRPPCPADKLCLHFGNVSEPKSLDPHKSTGTWESRVINDVIEGLTTDDPEGKPIPGMAESWTVSPDGLTWTFNLREATWSDGVPVTADDFVFSLRRILDPETAAEYASLIYVIKNAQPVNEGKMPVEALGVRAIDRRTLEIQLEHPAPYLTELANHQTMYPVPKHVVERWGDDWMQPEHFVGNGAYVLRAWKLGDHVLVDKNPRYYNAQNVCIDRIFYYPTTDAVAAQRRVLRGELDVNADIQSNRINALRSDPASAPYVRVNTYLGVAYIAFNAGPQGEVPGLKDVRVRRALAMAIDREFITNKLLRGGQVPAYSFVPPGVANYVEKPPLPYYAGWTLERRQAEARRLLREAGYGPNNPLVVEIKHRNSADPMLVMPAIQADWRAVGVDARLIVNETQIAYQSYRIRDFDVADAAWIADFNDPMSFLYLQQSATGSQNYGDYNNPEFDRLLALADREPDSARRAQYLYQAEKIMLDDAPVAPTYFYVNKSLVAPDITGWVDNIVDRHRAKYLCFQDRQARLGR